MRIEVDIGKTLRSNGRAFMLDVKFACDDDLGVIFGPSGAGKSLTLRAIAGDIVARAGGHVVLAGLLAEQVPEVVAAFAALELVEVLDDDGWAAPILRTRAGA